MRLYNLIKLHFKNINFISLFSLGIKTFIILILLNLSDVLYSEYNENYSTVRLFFINHWLFAIVISILLFNKLWIRIFLLALILFTMLIQYLFYQYFGTFIQPIAFYQVFGNTNEVIVSFIDELISMVIPVIIVLAIFMSIVVMKTMRHWQSYRNNVLGIIILLTIFSRGIYNTNYNFHLVSGKIPTDKILLLLPLPEHHSSVNFMRSLNYFLVNILPKKISGKTSQDFPELIPPKIKDSSFNRNIILIIGESLRAKELGLLGYSKNTTPLLKQVDSLYTSSVYAGGTMTKSSVSSLLNRMKYPGVIKQLYNQKNNLFQLAKQNGFTTHFYSAQEHSELIILQNYLGRKFIDYYADREILENKIDGLNLYDMALVQIMKKISIDKENHFIVLHQRGSHSPYHEQYPEPFDKFQMTYDNTVLYTDYMLSELIKNISEASSKPTYIIYTSDHGELLHEHGRNGHGWFFKEVYRVPFIYYSIHQNQDNIGSIPLSNIQSHFQVSNLLSYLFGYDINLTKETNIYVNGADVDALGGYLHIKLDSFGNEVSITESR